MDAEPRLRGTYGSALGKAMLAYATSRGVAEGEALALMGATRAELDEPDARLPFGPAVAFWAHLVRELGDPGVPVAFASAMSASDFGVLGFAAMTAPTVGAGLARAARYYDLLADTARLALSECPGGLRVEVVRPGERDLALRIMTENTVACLLRVVRSVARREVVPLEASFAHAAPADVSAHRAFFGPGLRFGAGWDGLALPAATLAERPPMPDANMETYFERHAAELARRLRAADTLADRVRAAIAHDLTGGEPHVVSVARRLGASERSLRRQLRAEGVTFRALVDDVRRSLAAEYLGRGDANVTEVAYLLGFSEPSAFTRAFKRWHGKPPRALHVRVPSRG